MKTVMLPYGPETAIDICIAEYMNEQDTPILRNAMIKALQEAKQIVAQHAKRDDTEAYCTHDHGLNWHIHDTEHDCPPRQI